MVLNKGMFTDCEPAQQPEGTWRYASGAIFDKMKKVLANEDGFYAPLVAFNGYGTGSYKDKKICLHFAFPDDSVVIWSYDSTDNKSEIGVLDVDAFGVDTYTIIVKDANIPTFQTALGSMRATGTYDNSGNRIVSWVSAVDKPRMLNVDDLPFTLNGDKSLVTITDWDRTLTFQEFNYPTAATTLVNLSSRFEYGEVLDQGGSLLSGMYSVFFAYEDKYGARTGYTIPFGTYWIADDGFSVPFDSIDGCAANSKTSKSLKISLSASDTRYKKLVIGILARNAGTLTAKIVGKINTNNTAHSFTYYGNEANIEDITLNELIVPTSSYIRARDVTAYKDTQYLANLEVDDDIDYQQYANNIVVNYRTSLINALDATTKNSSKRPNSIRVFMHEQVYALYIGWILNNGKLSKLFHIPGRAPKAGETDAHTINGISAKKYQIRDTNDANGQSYAESTADGIKRREVTNTSVSNMGYWENENEFYPTNFPSGLAGQRIRHHKFPSLNYTSANHWSPFIVDPTKKHGRNMMDGFTIDVTNVVSGSMAGKAKGWLIFAAKVNPDNSNVICQDMLLYASSPKTDSTIITTSAGNWEKLIQTPINANRGSDLRNDYIRLHAFDLLKSKPSVNPDYIKQAYKLTKSHLNDDYTIVGKSGGQVAAAYYFDPPLSEPVPGTAASVIDFTDIVNCNKSAVTDAAGAYNKLGSFRYLPANTNDGNIKNQMAEECALATLVSPFNSSVSPSKFRILQGPLSGNFNSGYEFEQTFIVSVNSIKKDLFTPFNSQEVFALNAEVIPINTSNAQGMRGDCFISYNTFITTHQLTSTDDSINPKRGIYIFRGFVCVTRNNVGLRYEDPALIGTKYYNKTPVLTFILNRNTPTAEFLFDKSLINTIAYNDDYTSVNDSITVRIHHPEDIFYKKFPNRLIASGKVTRTIANIAEAWKTFLDQDIYESNFDRGQINNIAVLDGNLLIHHEFGLFSTLAADRLKANSGIEITLGTTEDIFGVTPHEFIPGEKGYIGNSSKYSSIVFKGGYFCVDKVQGKAFLVKDNRASEISANGIESDFKYIFSNNINIVDVPGSSGLIACFDETHNRIILSVSNIGTGPNDPDPTMSYSLTLNAWVSYHGYSPQYLFNTRTKVFSISKKSSGPDQTEFCKHNNPLSKGIYYESGSIQNFVVTTCFGFPKDAQFINFNWYTQLFKIDQVSPTISGVQPLTTTKADRTKTFSILRAKTSYQDTGDITLTPFVNPLNPGNVRRENNIWNFNKLRDRKSEVTSYLNKGYLVDRYLMATLQYNNIKNLDNTQNILYLLEASPKAILAER